MDLVIYHVLETLIVRRPQENLRVNFPTSVAIVHHLVATQVVAVLLQERRNLLHVDGIVKRGSVADFALVRTQFT